MAEAQSLIGLTVTHYHITEKLLRGSFLIFRGPATASSCFLRRVKTRVT
jgi:hypothetical protein